MKNQFETLNNNLSNINHHLAPIAEAAQLLIESGALEKLADQLPEIITFLRKHFPIEEPRLFMPDVLDYLGIHKRTYYRKVADGKLIPRKWEGPDFFYRSDLEEERKESKRRGRI
ncbi:DNA-binding protein [Parapedobacter defluvii]|uniref:DNA-binding protein n=1 Tax=Parapedobacter defluvii TaxID=2045106 RepID=UPI00333F92B5